MQYGRSQLLKILSTVPRQGWTNGKINDLVNSLWRDPSAGGGRLLQISTLDGWVVWRYAGDAEWNNLFLIPLDGEDGAPGADGLDGSPGMPGADGIDGREIELRSNTGWVEWRYVGSSVWTPLYQIPLPIVDNEVKVPIDFQSSTLLSFTYKCPVAMKFTSIENESGSVTINPALNTNLSKYQSVTVTAPSVQLVILNGETL